MSQVEVAAEMVRLEHARQGLGPTISDPATCQAIAALMAFTAEVPCGVLSNSSEAASEHDREVAKRERERLLAGSAEPSERLAMFTHYAQEDLDRTTGSSRLEDLTESFLAWLNANCPQFRLVPLALLSDPEVTP